MATSQSKRSSVPAFDELDYATQRNLTAMAEARTLEELRGWVADNQERITRERIALLSWARRRMAMIIACSAVITGIMTLAYSLITSQMKSENRDQLEELRAVWLVEAKNLESRIDQQAHELNRNLDFVQEQQKLLTKAAGAVESNLRASEDKAGRLRDQLNTIDATIAQHRTDLQKMRERDLASLATEVQKLSKVFAEQQSELKRADSALKILMANVAELKGPPQVQPE